ncbi:LysE family translocator [Aliigemmobacter aestuarii]|uniref:LysE family translocator n=1 Tax=Aliigemmobacter aestuarii TaxID=1445661 RepID=A0A4S3MR65_9RHOB|nr:LysE family translocator [Gemmobacter aestuarii]THD84533.1 LysE family translocator [Gemmobacter aestuarii]
MTFDSLLALLVFAFVTSVTPGPNNLMLMTSGANFGFRRTVPHMLGISLGHAFMVFLVGLGIDRAFRVVPGLDLGLKIAAVIYMLWLAWKFAHADAPGEGRAGARPLTFLQAAAFQWVNPKAWAMALGAVAAYVPHPSVSAFALLALVFAAVNLPSVSVWAWAGQGVRRILSSPRRLRLFNWTMAGLLILSLVPVLRV